jgi:hypothetical protein
MLLQQGKICLPARGYRQQQQWLRWSSPVFGSIARELVTLQLADNFLLNGNKADWRGVPSKQLATTMARGTLRAKRNQAVTPKDVIALMTQVTAVIVVGGQAVLDRYKAMVIECTGIIE